MNPSLKSNVASRGVSDVFCCREYVLCRFLETNPCSFVGWNTVHAEKYSCGQGEGLVWPVFSPVNTPPSSVVPASPDWPAAGRLGLKEELNKVCMKKVTARDDYTSDLCARLRNNHPLTAVRMNLSWSSLPPADAAEHIFVVLFRQTSGFLIPALF